METRQAVGRGIPDAAMQLPGSGSVFDSIEASLYDSGIVNTSVKPWTETLLPTD